MRHISMTCENHPDLRWSCKSIAVTNEGRYNGARNIFFLGVEVPGSPLGTSEWDGENFHRECSCPGSALIARDMEQVRQARAEGD